VATVKIYNNAQMSNIFLQLNNAKCHCNMPIINAAKIYPRYCDHRPQKPLTIKTKFWHMQDLWLWLAYFHKLLKLMQLLFIHLQPAIKIHATVIPNIQQNQSAQCL